MFAFLGRLTHRPENGCESALVFPGEAFVCAMQGRDLKPDRNHGYPLDEVFLPL